MKTILNDFSAPRLIAMFFVAILVVSQGPWGEWMKAEAWRMPVFVAIVAVAGTSIWRWKDKNSSDAKNEK